MNEHPMMQYHKSALYLPEEHEQFTFIANIDSKNKDELRELVKQLYAYTLNLTKVVNDLDRNRANLALLYNDLQYVHNAIFNDESFIIIFASAVRTNK